MQLSNGATFAGYTIVTNRAAANDDGRKQPREKFAGDSLGGVSEPPPKPPPGWYADPSGAPGGGTDELGRRDALSSTAPR
jgi:hypothetical protein